MPRIRQKADIYRNEDFRREVRARLAYLGIKQHDLAEYLGVCDGSMSLLLQSPEKISVERLRKMVDYLGLEPRAVLLFCGYQNKKIKEVSDDVYTGGAGIREGAAGGAAETAPV